MASALRVWGVLFAGYFGNSMATRVSSASMQHLQKKNAITVLHGYRLIAVEPCFKKGS